jgi:hypothetical protein
MGTIEPQRTWDGWTGAGDWIGPTGGSTTTANRPNGFAYAVPIFLPGKGVDQVQMEVVTTPGSAGSVHRIGAYEIRADRIPRLIAEASSTADTTATGAIAKDIVVPSRTGWVWLVAVQQGAPGTPATMRVTNGFVDGVPPYGTGTSVTSAAAVLLGSGITGALPSTLAALAANLNTNTSGPFLRARLTA